MEREWSKLNRQQLGTYAEYYAKMRFTVCGWSVFTSEVDDHGIDFVASPVKAGTYFEIQVKSICASNYVYIPKDKMCHDQANNPLPKNRIVCVANFIDGQEPDLYLIPAPEWNKPNELLRDRNYEGKQSKPEWGINLSKKNQHILDKYSFYNVIKTFE